MDFEKLGSFYLGKEYDIKNNKLTDNLVMYDSRNFTTHAVCIGMTGSGKTGLCIDILEEAALDNIPAIIIDPKGDITNLLLTFPELKKENFSPWVDPDEANRKGMSIEEYAQQQAEMWKKGLSDWGQDEKRIKMLRDSTDFLIYTPGSEAGTPVSILHSFDAPSTSWEDESELIREQIQGIVSGILGLIGIEADPINSREHILLSNIFEYFWSKNQNLDIGKLILSIQNPPFRTLGVFEIDTFIPNKDRMALSMKLNSLIASPSFKNWLEGQPLDISEFMKNKDGKPRHSIFYIAHLNDSERMFFVTLLFNQIISWMRKQSGTNSLRTIIYMDEIFGYFPPVANPPSKKPLLTLLKQARAFGVGIILATQNPVDLDYKGLTNTGTWFIGRLQTERDKQRLLEGLDTISSSSKGSLNREEIDKLISNLGKRVFILHSVHENTPVIFQTRWAMSYLRGPLTKNEIKSLMKNKIPEVPVSSSKSIVSNEISIDKTTTSRPTISSEIQQVFIPLTKSSNLVMQEIKNKNQNQISFETANLIYNPGALGKALIHYQDKITDLREDLEKTLILRSSELMNWEKSEEIKISNLLTKPEANAKFGEISGNINDSKDFNELKKNFADFIFYNSNFKLYHSPLIKIYSKPRESKSDFILRITQMARERRDEEVDKIEEKYSKDLQKLKEKLERSQEVLLKKQATANSLKQEAMVSAGESVIKIFMGRRSTTSASKAMNKYQKSKTVAIDIQEAQKDIETLNKEMELLENKLKIEVESIKERREKEISEIKEVLIQPKKSDIEVKIVSLAWIPYWEITYKKEGKLNTEIIPGYL
ncbi:MAG TPA: hypothetical protein PLO36_03345 [Methanofastidiosum sp.]|nr:hypothetical protein [Methanofastidiosum sp.]HPA49150.1 hypothetical protein [Methanofastidiosum sp.]HQK62440.1 hypothetical protein [Methanofastidiosum sp.]HQM94609.1 hypothetical protein [Methanofastidiosum sp.]HQQ48608.1 hypothetical protein [Methanofastidiosum sp.]